MVERCPYCGRLVEGGLTNCLENGSPACDECIEKEEQHLKEKQSDLTIESRL